MFLHMVAPWLLSKELIQVMVNNFLVFLEWQVRLGSCINMSGKTNESTAEL